MYLVLQNSFLFKKMQVNLQLSFEPSVHSSAFALIIIKS